MTSIVNVCASFEITSYTDSRPLLPGDNYSRFTIGKTLFTPVLERLAARHAFVKSLGTNRTKWQARQQAVRTRFESAFAPNPSTQRPKSPRVIHRGKVAINDNCSIYKLLVETHPG